MKYRFAFAGFRHPHIFSLWEGVKNYPRCEIVGACEPDAVTRKTLEADGKVTLTHDDFESMLSETEADVVAIGDVYARRGALCIRALETGRHVISDKPLCTHLSEWERIETIAQDRKLAVGCQFDLGDSPVMRKLREIIRSHLLGRICTITILAQHPLRLKSRAAWYFEKGAHGGTINDIGVHILDLVPWLTGQRWTQIVSSRQWNAKAVGAPHFKDCAQFHGLLERGVSCFADMSYLAPDLLGYEQPHYWRITVHGTKGMAETDPTKQRITVVLDDDKVPQDFFCEDGAPLQYLNDFLAQLNGKPVSDGMTTSRVLLAARLALEAQHVADSDSGIVIPFQETILADVS